MRNNRMTGLGFSISEADAARQLGWSEETLARIRKSHELPHVRVREGECRYTAAQLDEIFRRFTPKPGNKVSER